MALQTGTNQNENSEPTKIEEISGVAGATDLTDVTPKEEETTFTSAGNLFNSPIDPPTKKTSSPMREGEAAARRAANGIDNTVGHDINNATPVASEAMGFLDSMAAHAPRDTRISRPIDQSVDFEKYKDYLTSNSFYFDGDSNLDKARAENQSNWAQARNATFRTLLNVVPEAIKQTANAFDFEDWSKAEAETGNWVSDAMTSAQESVKDVLPIYRENPGQALDVGDFAYWMEIGDSLVTSIGGFALSGYALGGGVSVLSKGASGLAKIGALVADSVKNTRSFRTALGAIEARGTGEAVRGLTLNYLMNRSESLGIAAETYATVYEREYNKAIVEGKSNEEAKTTAKRFAAEGAAGSMKFNALNMILNTTSSNLFLKSAKVSSLIKKEGIGTAIGEVGKEGLEEYVNDLGQLYGEGLNTEAPLTFKAAMQRLGTAEGLESPILGFIGGAGQPALTKAGKYIQTTDNSSYVRNFNQYLLDNPITATNKEETLQKAVAYAQTQSDKDAKIGFFTNTANAGGQRTSTAQQLESLYVAQQVALSDYEKADKASNMNDVVNMSISSEFSVNLMNELSSDPTISPEQKDILLERALLSHQAYKAMSVGTMSELKDVYRTYSNMEAKEATDRGLLKDEVEGTPEHYKTKAKRALQTLDAYEANYNVSKGFVNSSEVYKSLNDIHFATRTVKEASDKYNDKAAELDTLSRELFESEGDTEALKFYESVQASNRIAIHPKLKGTKIDEEIQDERKAVKVAKQNKLNSVVNFQTITSSTYTKNLNDLVKLYKNKQIAEANKTKATKTFSEGFKNVFTSKAKTTSAKANKTKNTSTTGGSNPNTTTPPATNTASAIAKAKAANNANANKGTVTPPPAPPPPAPPVKTPNTNVKNPNVFTFDTSNVTASTTMQMFVDGDTKKINGILNSGDSIETKIAKLEQDVENKIKYDRVGAKNLAPDGTEVIDSLIAKIQDKISELQNELVSLSPEVRESKEAYEALVTDFGLDLEEERLLSTDIVDEDGNAIENTKAIVDSKYDIYSSILEQMKNRGVDTSNFEDVMFDFKSILGDRLTQSEFNSLQGLYNFTNNTNHNSSYKEIFGTLGEIDNDIDTANRIAKVTLPEGRFTYDLDVESQMALQAERQAIIVENPNAEVKGLAFPIYNEEGGNKIAYLAQQYSKVARQEVNKDGETYTLVDKVTTTGLLNVDLDSKTLEPDFFNVNDVITFMPLESFVNEDGETIMADTLPVSEKPVGLIINGELVQGLFLHTTSWINATNINNTSEHIEQDRLSLLALRTKIFNGESVTAKITEVSTGAPIKNPNNSSRTFLSEFATHPVGIIRNGLLETSSGIIEVPEYLSFPEGSVVIKVGDYFHYGSRAGLFAPMRQAIITGIRAFATGVESEGIKYLKQNQGLDATTSKGLEGYVRQLVNVSPVKVGESYPTNLEEFITALNTRPETEVYVNFIKGDLYIGRGQGLDVIQISQKGYAHDTRSLDVLLNEIEGLLQDSYANVDLPSLKTNESIVIIGEAGITRTFDTYDEYVKQVSTSIYGSIDLPSGTNITTIQKRVSFETETIDAESNPKKKRAYKKRETKKAPIVIDNPTGSQTRIEFNTISKTENLADGITDDLSPDIVGSNKPNIILPIGTSGSGKSTWIKSLALANYTVISPDEMRVEFTGDINDKTKDVEIYKEAANRALEVVKNNKTVIFDTTNLTKDKRRAFINSIRAVLPNANIQYKLLPLNPALAKERIRKQIENGENRANVSDDTIDRQALSYKDMLNDIQEENITAFNEEENLLSPDTNKPLISPSLIPGLSNKLQQIIIQDIVLDYYGLLIKATKNKDKVGKLADFYDKKVAEFDEVVLTLEKQNYAGIIKVRQQVEIIKANKAKILEIARQNLTKQLGVRVNEGNLELDNTNDSTASNDEEIDAPDGIPAEDASERSRIYDANEFGIDPKLSMSNSIRHMLYGIVDAQLGFKEEIVREVVDGVEQERVVRVASINYRKVPLQVPVYVNANEVYEDLVKLFAKSSINVGMDVAGFIPDVNSKLHPKIQVAIEILKSKYTIKPYYSNVVDKLENMDMETQLNFIRAFNKNVTDHIKVIEYLDKDGQSLSLKIIKNSTQNAVNNLKQKWNINLKAISGYVPNDDYMTLNPVIYQAFTNSYNKIKGDTDLHTYENFKNMFSVIGITLSNAAFEKLRAGVFVGGKPKNLNQQFEHTQGYFNRIKKQVDYIMNGGPNGTAIDVNLLYQDKVFTEFANFLMDFDKSVFNNSYTNGNGDTIYGVTNNRYFMERFIGLKNNLKLLKNLKNNKFSSKSAWLNNLYNENNGAINKGDFHDTFSYSTLDSYTVRETNKSKMVDTLTRVEMVKLGISLFMNKGRNILNNTIPISKFIIPALSDKTNLFVVEAQGRFYSLNNNTLLGTDLNFLRSQLFEGEFLRIIEAQAKGPIGVNGYDTGSNKFLLFPLFNDIEGLFNEGRINVDALNDPIIVARINEVIMDYIITGSTDIYNDWQAMKLLKPGKIDESTGITIYSEKMDFMDSNYAKFASKHVRQTMEEGKSLALNYHINYLVANANMQQLLFNDPAYYYKKGNEEQGTTDIQETFDNVTKRYAAVNGGKDDFIFPAGSTFDVLSIQDANVVSSRHDYLESLWAGHPDFVETMKSYSNMTSGDAQEYTSLEEHLDRMIYGNMISEETGKRVLKTYKETGSVSKEDLGRILIPFKPLYFNTYPGTDGIMRTLYIKTSSLPLIKELTKGTQLDALREYLDNPKTTPKVAVFESGIKAGKPTKSLALFDEKGNLDAKALKGNLNAHIITKIPREGHGNQQANPDKSLKSVVNDGTQQAKLLFTNILDVLGFKNPFVSKDDNKIIKENAKDIYNKLGNKTQSNNIIIKSVYQQKGVDYATSINGIFSLRLNNTNNHFGNPFSSVQAEIDKGLIATGSTKESVEKYIDWVINSSDNRAKQIRIILKEGKLKNKPIIYYKELNEPSHATALDYLINTYNWNNNITSNTLSGRELATMYLNRYEDRFKKQYDKLVKELKIDANGNIGNMAKLQKLLVDEAVSRGWTFNESSSFELDDTGLNFKIPLWMSISSVKIESLLSSIVDNRIRKRKRYGRAYILASDAGVRTYNPEVDNASTGIVFTEDFTGELKNSYNDNGEMTSAEVLVPFRFYDNKGNLLKITDFMVDGKIDTNKLPVELLNGFGYRIPTSGVNLMSNIKIVGFLPESYGDVVIAPADFTVQMGSDFDVDKMYSNTYATFYDSKLGKLTRLDQSHIKQKDDITEAINLLFKEIKLYSKYKGKKKADIIKELNNQIKVLRDTEIYKIKDLDILVLDNEITDIQRAVLNNVATEVQRARTKPLSFGRLPEMIKKFGLSFDTTYYSFLNRNVQDTSYLNGNLGKTAVGNFSLDMILNSLGQYIKTPVYFQHKVSLGDAGYKYVRTPIKAFGFVGNNINEPYLNDGSGRYKSDVLEGLMAAALDNGKEQILGKLGISDKTFDFIRAMVATGYNEEVIMGILAQPIMKLYLDPVTDSKVKAQMEQATRLIKKKTTFLEDTALDELTTSLYDYNIYKANLDEFGKALVKSVKDGTSESFSKTTQVAVLTMYLAMESKGQSLSQVRSALNVDSAGVGKNIIYSTAKLEQHEKTLENPSINNIEKYFVNYKYNEETDTSEKDFVSIGNSALFYAARTNTKLWGKFFPFSNKTMEKVVKTIAKRTGKDIFRLNSYSDYATLVLRDFKSFLSAANLPKALPSFMKDMSNKDIYKSIILSSPSNQSLGEFILNLRENTSNSIKYSNDLLDGLDIDRIDNSLSTNVNPILVNIGYSNNKRIDNNEDNIVNAISEMINEPVDLGTWNGNPITSKDLANILIAYQLISRGVPGSNKFIQFIPTEQLRRLGYYESMSDNYRALLGFNSTSNSKANSAQFIMQHLQHNMADYYEPSADRTHKDSFENGVYVGENFKNMPTYIVFKEDGTYYAQHKTKTGFIRLNPLGWGPNTEYNHDVYNPVSINPDNNKSMINVTTVEVEDNSTDVTAPFVNKALGNILINSSLGKQTVIDVVTGYNENTEEDITTEMKAYPITLTENGSTVDYFLVKNGSTYNSLYHPVTQYMIPINGLTASTTKVERDIKIMESLAELNPLDVEALGLTEEVETSNIAAIEANIKEFMTPSRDKSEDVFPDDINTVTREFADELGLSDTSLNLEDKYRLIFSRIIGTVGSSNKVLSYFLSRATDIIPLLSSTPIVLDTTLKAKGMYNSNGYIVINPNKFTTIEDMANVIAHEAIHGLFKKQVKVKNPIVKDLERFRKEVEAELVVEFGQEAIDNMKAKLKMGVPLTAGVEADLLYPILNVDELITGVLTNPAFQTYLNSKEMKLAKKSLWTKVLELMSSMLRVLGVKENSKLEDSLGAIFALTNDIRDNHLNNIPNPKYQRSLAFINERFNLVSNTNTLLPKGNAQQIVDFINNNFANTTATVVEGKYVEIIPTVFLSPSTTKGDLSSDVWDLEFINDEMDNTQASTKESKGNYYTYAASLRARVIQGEHILNKAKVSQDIIAIEEATNSLMEDKVSLINIRRIQSFADFAMRAKEDYAKVSAILDGPMNSEDITYARNILNFWKNVREYSFTSKHRESEQLMRTFGIIEDEAETAIKRLELIEKNYLEDFIKDTIGKDITLDDLFATYSDIDIVSSNVRDISTYDNDLLTSIWKRVQLANMEAETESETLLKSLNTIIDKVMPKLKAINSRDPYEIFRQLSENGLKTNHLINAYSSKFYSDRSRAYTLAKNGQDFATVNNYANWIKAETKAFKLSEYFPSGGVITPEVLANREALRQEVGDFAYNMWFNGQSKKLNSYNKRKDAIIATIKADNGMELSDDITSNPKALQAITNWSKKHSPYEFSNVVNNSNYKYQDGSDGIDGFSTYEILPNKPEHFNKDFEVIANDADLLEFYNEFSSIYESLKLHVPASQFANLIFGGLPVIEQSIYQAYSTKGLKGLFKGIKTAWANSITSTITKEGATELDLVTGDNSKQMFIPGIKSNSNAIKTYVNTKAIAYEVKTGSLPSQTLLAQYREEAVNELANKGDFDLGKLMKVFGTLVIAHKQIASVENLIKIGQYTLNSYKENQFNSDGSIATRSGGGNAVLPAENSFPNTKKSFTYFINSQVYGNVKDEEMVFERKKYTAEEDELKASLDKSLQELEAKYEAGEVTETFYNSLKNSIVRNVDNLGKNVVGSKIGDNWLKYVQLKLMGWNILGGFSNSAFGFIGNMIEAAGEGSFTLSEMNEAYRMTASSVAKNLSFDKLKLGESGKIRSAMDKLNVLKEASHELYTSNEATSFGGKFKFASPYNMNQRTEYLNQAPLMIVMAKKTMVDTIGGRISIWDGMNADWEWDEATYGPMPTKVILDMRVAITKHIQRIHGNYDPASPLMIKKTIAGRAISQFRTWLYEAVAVRFEKERMEHAIGTTVKGRYRTVGGLIFENEGRIGGLELTKEFSKALLNSFTFGAIKLKSFENTKLSDIDSQNMRKVAMELVLLLDVYILIALLKAGLSDDEDEAKGLYNVLLNQGTRLKSDLLLYINPIETRNILKDIIPAVSLFDDTVGFMKAVTNLEEDTVTTGVHQGNSKLGTATMKLLPGTSKFYSSYNAWSQIFDKDIKISKKDDNTEE